MVNLFAMLPAEKKYEIPVKAVQMARRLSMEFNAYVVRTNALRKVFVSIKGFYYQVRILGGGGFSETDCSPILFYARAISLCSSFRRGFTSCFNLIL